MSAESVSQQLSGTEPQEVEQYRSLSALAIASLLLGVVSAFAVAHPGAWVIAVAAVVCGLVAQIRVARRPDTLTGRRLALLGMGLGLFFGCWGVSRYTTYNWALTRDARSFAEQWLAAARDGELEVAHQATLGKRRRQPEGTILTEYYQNNPEQLNAMQEFFSEGMAKRLVDLKGKGQIQFERTAGSFTQFGTTTMALRYYVVPDKPSQPKLHLQIELSRHAEDDGFYWSVLSVDDTRMFDERPF